MSFSLWERAVLVLLIAIGLYLFLRELLPKISRIRAGQSDRPRTDRLGVRIARVVREVLLQTKVIGGRPVVGLMHAVVFFGFLCFGLETMDHFLEPFNLPILHTLLGGAEPLFKSFLVLVAALVSIAILGLAFRRFVLVKISPGPKSWSSGVVALMIFLLMVTYINGVAAQPFFAKANWWLHALLILAFPPLILRSKHFHILMAPVNIFLRTERVRGLPAAQP